MLFRRANYAIVTSANRFEPNGDFIVTSLLGWMLEEVGGWRLEVGEWRLEIGC